MKMTKKKVFVAALAICLVAIISVGSLAWFSAQDSVDNKFYVADSDDDTADEIFSVDVYEYTEDSPTEKVPAGETYNEIAPGDTLRKEPHVANTGHYDQYIRVVVTISDAANWQAILGNDFNDATLLACFDGFDQSKWNNISTEVLTASDEIRIVMYYDGILDGSDTANDATSGTDSDITVFKNVMIPTAMDQAQAAAFGTDGFSIVVKAQAVQTDNVGDNAFAAFQTVGMAIDA